jgi:nucleotide-binding universal stress UspA family protein
MFTNKKILVGYDGSNGGKAALAAAATLAEKFEAQVTAFWVREPLPRHSDLPGEYEGEAEAADEYFEERQKEVAAVAAQYGLSIPCEVRRGHAAKVLVTLAKEGTYDLIVVGHSDHSELWGRLLGDTADRISDHAHCSVLIVKTGSAGKSVSASPWSLNPKPSL